MSSRRCTTHYNACDCREEKFRALEARELGFIQSLREMELQLAKLREALHEIYGKACQAMSEDDDLYLYSFAKDARDIALEAAIDDDLPF